MGSERQEWSVGVPLAEHKPVRARMRAVLRPAFSVLGVALLVLLVQDVGTEELGKVLSRAAPWLPLVLALEAARLWLDAVATWVAYGSRTRDVPFRSMIRAQLISAAVSNVAPAGRAAGEATKAALLSPYTGGATAMAAAATSQAASLVSGGLISIPCALAAYLLTGASWLTLALGVHTVVLVLVGLGMRAGMRARKLGAWLKQRFHRFAPHTETFQESARDGGLLPTRPIVATFLGRTLQVVQYGTLAVAVGIDTTAVEALVAQGLNLVAMAVGALVPGQFGVSDGAFAMSARAFGTTTAKAMSIALLTHVMQVLFVLVGSLTPLVWKARTPSPQSSVDQPA
ncbi:lysylphosphatidylglycerol synthase transmembrane domain-containing protein [Archangium sp.]|uniref:lysylphosphatidylglycerol synthase transmembrane domain-containing protein n=1 Tax=Archangium sp. TaxID=1872627 RepID=UPI002D5AC0CA|nr:lysylphosphatidylglycerol synthase transmembrane domain-containing protein [Archangium sp.]HYO52715.1 lysylphosphatidylglycerol synthase transmembrane domain-containing protein [Archangium sp.]